MRLRTCSLISCVLWLPEYQHQNFCGDWNSHVGHAGTGYREVHGGMGYDRPVPDVEGERILEYALAFDLLLGNTCFKKRDSHLITYKSGNIATQIEFILFRRTMRKRHRCKSDPWRGSSSATSASCMQHEDWCATKIQAQVHPSPQSLEA